MAATIRVTAPHDEDYEIIIDRGLIARAAERLTGRTAVVTNTTLAERYGQPLVDSLPDAVLVIIPDGEQYKTLATTADLYRQFVSARLDRASTVVALGGGVVGDVAGFAAATYMRGVAFVQMPTTLLAMVDSSVGGKVGVDLPEGKNLVGAFKSPQVVLIDPNVLHTLPPQERRNGMAEVIKHGLLADAGLLDPALHVPERAEELICRAVQVKVDVVQRDPYERGERAHLNLGHTFGHAIEQVSGYCWAHGAAVAVGLVAALRLSYRLGLCGKELSQQVETIIAETGLPTRTTPDLDPEALYAVMATDKKWQGGRSRFVLLRGIGEPEIVTDVPREDVLTVMRSLIAESRN